MKRWSFLETSFFAAFLIWSAAGLIFTIQHITPEAISHWSLPPQLIQFIISCLSNGDPILIFLAFANTHLHASRQWTPAIARRWGFFILFGSLAVETIGAHTGYPFGVYSYTDHFGPRLGAVPLAIPLAWHVVVTNALFIVRTVAPHGLRIKEAVLAGLLCTLYDFILEPFATKVKGYWIWADGSIPPFNYAAWFVISGLLALLFAPSLSTRYPRDPRPWLILGITLLIFAAGRWAMV